MAALVSLNRGITSLRLTTRCWKQLRLISTSKKNRETATIAEPIEKSETVCKPEKTNWVSYGFDFVDETADKNAMNSIMFFSVTCCLVFGGFVYAYLPDFQMRDWAQREGYLELRRREEKGLPPIDANLIDPKNIVLPSDDELADVEIII